MSTARFFKLLLALLGIAQLVCLVRIFVVQPTSADDPTAILQLGKYAMGGVVAGVMMVATAVVGRKTFRKPAVVLTLSSVDLLVWAGLFVFMSAAA